MVVPLANQSFDLKTRRWRPGAGPPSREVPSQRYAFCAPKHVFWPQTALEFILNGGDCAGAKDTIERQKAQLAWQWSLLQPRRPPTFYEVQTQSQPNQSGQSSAATGSAAATGGFSRANVEAVHNIRATQLGGGVEHTPELKALEQQNLLLRFFWEDYKMVFQSLSLLSMEQATLSWKPLGDLSPSDLKAKIPDSDPKLLFVMKEQDISQFVKFTVDSQLVRSFHPSRLDMLVTTQGDVRLAEWSDTILGKLPWVPESFTRFSRPLERADGSTVHAVVITSTARSIKQRVKPEHR